MKSVYASMVMLLLLAGPRIVEAQSYPDRAIRIIVPFGAGGATDVAARAVGNRLGMELKQAVVIENRPGAGSNIGLDAAAKSPSDGYTLVFAGNELVSNPSLYHNLRFDAAKDFVPISLITRMPSLLVVNSESPFETVQQLVAHAKANPGVLNYASGGNGTLPHFNAELFKKAAGNIDVLHVPYRSTQEMITSLLGGQTAFAFATPSSVGGQIQAGKLRVLGISGAKRSSQYPDAPTMSETVPPGFVLYGWGGILAPAGVSPSIIEDLNAAIVKALADPSLRQTLAGAGFEVIGNSSREFAAQIQKELTEWPAIVKQSGAKID